MRRSLATLGLDEVSLLTHDMGDSVGGELLARSLDGTLSFEVTSRVLTNGSVYIDMAHLTDGQQLLLSLPDEQLAEGLGRDALVDALRGTFAPDAVVPDDDLQVGAELILRDGGDRLLPRTIRYVEERREHEGRWTGAIERHPSPLTIVWGDVDPIAVWPMAERVHAARRTRRWYGYATSGITRCSKSPKSSPPRSTTRWPDVASSWKPPTRGWPRRTGG